MITRKNDAFVAKIVNMRLTKIFMGIFAPDERLPSSATLMQWFLELFLAWNSSCSLFLCVLPFTKGLDYGRGKADRWSIQYWDQMRGSGRYGWCHTLSIDLKHPLTQLENCWGGLTCWTWIPGRRSPACDCEPWLMMSLTGLRRCALPVWSLSLWTRSPWGSASLST